jgi:hypothetical protein
MKILHTTNLHEVLRRWVLGEIESDFFDFKEVNEQERVRQLLLSDDVGLQCEGILSHAKRAPLWTSFPPDTQWSIAELELTECQFQLLRTLKISEWQCRSLGSCSLIEAANNIETHPNIDERVTRAVDARRRGLLTTMSGITLHSTMGSNIATVAEGTARLIALYLCDIKIGRKATRIEVALGVSRERWRFAPPI